MMNMSKISPMAIVDPAWPMFLTSLERSASIVPARTRAAVTATLKEPAIALIMPVANPENGFGDLVQGDQVGRVAHVVIRLHVEGVGGQLALREVPVRGRVPFDGLAGVGCEIPVVVAHLVGGEVHDAQ